MFRAEKAVEGWGKEVLIWETGLDRHKSLGHTHTVYRTLGLTYGIRHSPSSSLTNILSHFNAYHQSSPYTDHPPASNDTEKGLE